MIGTHTKYVSGVHSVATMMGGLEHESPLLPFNNEVLVFKTKWRIMADFFAALDYNTPIPAGLISGDTAYLIDEGPRTPNGLCVDWERTYARIPAAYDMPGGVIPFTIPSIDDGTTDGGRDSVVIPVPLTIRRTFYLCGNFGAFSKWQDIPVNLALRVYNVASTNGLAIAAIDTGVTLDSETTPSFSDYINMVTAKQLIQIKDSAITPWRGSIFVREDYLVQAI